jgi:hypothetical protein
VGSAPQPLAGHGRLLPRGCGDAVAHHRFPTLPSDLPQDRAYIRGQRRVVGIAARIGGWAGSDQVEKATQASGAAAGAQGAGGTAGAGEPASADRTCEHLHAGGLTAV